MTIRMSHKERFRQDLADLETRLKKEYDDAKYYGEHERAAEIENHFFRCRDELEKLHMSNQQSDYQNAYAQALGQQQNITGINAAQGIGITDPRFNSHLIGQMQNAKTAEAEKPMSSYAFDTLYLRGQPLPEDWAGAKIDKYDRSVNGSGTTAARWMYQFSSKWGTDKITLHLDAQQLSGKEADEIAQTYMEVLNQRRVG